MPAIAAVSGPIIPIRAANGPRPPVAATTSVKQTRPAAVIRVTGFDAIPLVQLVKAYDNAQQQTVARARPEPAIAEIAESSQQDDCADERVGGGRDRTGASKAGLSLLRHEDGP